VESVAPRIGDVKTKEGLKTVFAHIDKESDGVLDFEELKIVSRMVGDNINDDDLLEMLHSTHINRQTQTNESINFEEFYQIVTKFYKK
jgi:Ca2+-binding EF-hand superfamily protein